MDYRAGTAEIYRAIYGFKGKNVRLRAVSDRNRVLNVVGRLDGVYPRMFTVFVKKDGYTQRYSYTYSEVITGHVTVAPL